MGMAFLRWVLVLRPEILRWASDGIGQVMDIFLYTRYIKCMLLGTAESATENGLGYGMARHGIIERQRDTPLDGLYIRLVGGNFIDCVGCMLTYNGFMSPHISHCQLWNVSPPTSRSCTSL